MPRTVFAEVAEATPLTAPIVEEQAAAPVNSFFDIVESDPAPTSTPAFASEFDSADQIEIDDSPELPRRPQTADGTFGDDLDIPEFLRG
jgi:hypothetical protein